MLEKISNIFIETEKFKSKLELELNILEFFYLDSLTSPSNGVELLQGVSHLHNKSNAQQENEFFSELPLGKETLQDKIKEQEQEQVLVKGNSKNISTNKETLAKARKEEPLSGYNYKVLGELEDCYFTSSKINSTPICLF